MFLYNALRSAWITRVSVLIVKVGSLYRGVDNQKIRVNNYSLFIVPKLVPNTLWQRSPTTRLRVATGTWTIFNQAADREVDYLIPGRT